ncbi:TetR/AcrR family transcriptional regulator [Sporosarcina sp. FSL W8-0480]|uniref:TetR/AcrR family transcriptional regulator n=1 Tax=Sporosarcina sp. FSL W8-0480 TaxID=2954701 RepID=UPI0030DB93E8
MTEARVDPRILRTRKLITDAFIELSSRKEFKDITVKDITTEAMINRATFYYHFEDIYDLLEQALSDVLLIDLNCATYQNKELNKETLVDIFKVITNFQMALSNRCHRGYEDTIARIIREQLEVIFYKMLVKQQPVEEDNGMKLTAAMLGWGLYGASVEWKRNSAVQPEVYIKSAIPYILSGIGLDVQEQN